jgi:hypothetical protein
MNTFLDEAELAILTGRKMKGHQIEALRKMGIPFFVNAIGHPVVTRVAIEGRAKPEPVKQAWKPQVLQRG